MASGPAVAITQSPTHTHTPSHPLTFLDELPLFIQHALHLTPPHTHQADLWHKWFLPVKWFMQTHLCPHSHQKTHIVLAKSWRHSQPHSSTVSYPTTLPPSSSPTHTIPSHSHFTVSVIFSSMLTSARTLDGQFSPTFGLPTCGGMYCHHRTLSLLTHGRYLNHSEGGDGEGHSRPPRELSATLRSQPAWEGRGGMRQGGQSMVG